MKLEAGFQTGLYQEPEPFFMPFDCRQRLYDPGANLHVGQRETVERSSTLSRRRRPSGEISAEEVPC